MDNIHEILNQLNSLNPEWCKLAIQYMENDRNIDDKIINLFNILLNLLFDQLKNNQQDSEKIVNKTLGEENKILLKYIEPSLRGYWAFNCMRGLNYAKAKLVIDYLFDNVIVFFDPKFAESYSKYEINSREEFIDVARTLDGLTKFYVIRQYSKNAIIHDLLNSTGLKKELCNDISLLIHNNFKKLQSAIIIEKLNALK